MIGLRILVVDDDPRILRSLRRVLEADSHEVTVADGGYAGIEAFEAASHRGEPFAVVLLDLGMPDTGGRVARYPHCAGHRLGRSHSRRESSSTACGAGAEQAARCGGFAPRNRRTDGGP
jgi:hypothetical protein